MFGVGCKYDLFYDLEKKANWFVLMELGNYSTILQESFLRLLLDLSTSGSQSYSFHRENRTKLIRF